MKAETQGPAPQNAARTLSFLGQTVLAELVWDDVPRSLWRCYHIMGVVVPLEGIYEAGHFLVMDALEGGRFPEELFWVDIHSITTLERRTLED
ncbi:hypothetical protein [Metapseudomonas resinovorans]|uniref:Uncharacterized protein n=1 Tax=Metapseudomonas resinovorans NBRC 106553 TaxID=1245471 RepID=S6AV83_METRE|nr:hypothetical protein [Pseudomonas resinovorans]BAN50128.1 hypothetical protein PCA10_43960 [Pseudomonas resinovorans NBRC 106553]